MANSGHGHPLKPESAPWNAGSLARGRGREREAVEAARMSDTLLTRFWAKVRKGEGCWAWTGCRNRKGYGRIATWAGAQLAHRVSWTIHFAAIPSGMLVLHRCDNPACVRPDHLFLGTAQDNTDDMMAKERHRYVSPPGRRYPGRALPVRASRPPQGTGIKKNGPGWGVRLGRLWLGTFRDLEAAQLVRAEGEALHADPRRNMTVGRLLPAVDMRPTAGHI